MHLVNDIQVIGYATTISVYIYHWGDVQSRKIYSKETMFLEKIVCDMGKIKQQFNIRAANIEFLGLIENREEIEKAIRKAGIKTHKQK